MSVEITVSEKTDDSKDLFSPVACFGSDHGQWWRLYDNGNPSDTYFMGTGGSDRPIMFWYDDECNIWRMSSQSKKELKQYAEHISIVKIAAHALIEIYED